MRSSFTGDNSFFQYQRAAIKNGARSPVDGPSRPPALRRGTDTVNRMCPVLRPLFKTVLLQKRLSERFGLPFECRIKTDWISEPGRFSQSDLTVLFRTVLNRVLFYNVTRLLPYVRTVFSTARCFTSSVMCSNHSSKWNVRKRHGRSNCPCQGRQ